MIQSINLRLTPNEAASDALIRLKLSQHLSIGVHRITGYQTIRKSIDARGKQVHIQLSLQAFIDEPFHPHNPEPARFQSVQQAKHRVIVVGSGPAGLFAALRLIEAGIQPLILERGKDVRARRRDLARLNKEGIIDPDSNYCFGEGGAGTYSDGKLYTRSTKRGNVQRILQRFVQFGADASIAYEAHPHIGTNKLPHIIQAMRQQIIDAGGLVLFEQRLTDIVLSHHTIDHIITHTGEKLKADGYILATGHSARDIFELLHRKQINIEAKPFALGVRIEHPQALIDQIQYHCTIRNEHLPPASYSLVEQIKGLGVFSFCMCPGGIIAPAATAPAELVVNGWSPSKRNNPFANSGMVVAIDERHAFRALPAGTCAENDPLLFLHFQQWVERAAYIAGGGLFRAPAARMTDFSNRKISGSLPESSYLRGLEPADLQTVLPPFVYNSLADGFRAFGKKMPGFFTHEANVVATESRTSSPVRIPRKEDSLQHPQVNNLYPCGEGAGYAGGIVSAAMDGERVAEALIEQLGRTSR
jgi:uncharacterized FAD-dependent dehydrogenase